MMMMDVVRWELPGIQRDLEAYKHAHRIHGTGVSIYIWLTFMVFNVDK